jgi:hypothetical protein
VIGEMVLTCGDDAGDRHVGWPVLVDPAAGLFADLRAAVIALGDGWRCGTWRSGAEAQVHGQGERFDEDLRSGSVRAGQAEEGVEAAPVP